MTISGFRTFLIFLIPFSMIFEVSLGGRLMFAEVLTIATVPLLIFYSKEYKSKEFFVFFTLLSLWFVGQVVTDVVRNTPFVDLARGWAKILIFATNFFALSMIVNGNFNRAILLFFAISSGIALRLFFGLSESLDEATSLAVRWKFGYGHCFTLLGFIVSGYFFRSRSTVPTGIAASFIAPAVALFFNARSLFGVSGMAAALSAVVATQRRTLRTSELLVLGLALVFAGWGAVSLYSYSAERGYLGEAAATKFQNQAKSAGGLLLGGRIEPLGSFEAVKDSPILGHGSWAKNPYYINLMLYRAKQLGIVYNGPWYSDNIPTHSHLMGAWVEAGIFGGIFWLWVLYLAISAFFFFLRNPHPFSGFVLFVLIGLLWNILFSPFGLEARLYTAATLVLLILAKRMGDKKAEFRKFQQGRGGVVRKLNAGPA